MDIQEYDIERVIFLTYVREINYCTHLLIGSIFICSLQTNKIKTIYKNISMPKTRTIFPIYANDLKFSTEKIHVMTIANNFIALKTKYHHNFSKVCIIFKP